MTVEALIDNFKVLDLLDCPSVSPSFTLNALSRELPGMLEHRQTDRLKKLLNIFSKVQTSWLFPDATCFDFLMILRQLFHPIVSIDHKGWFRFQACFRISELYMILNKLSCSEFIIRFWELFIILSDVKDLYWILMGTVLHCTVLAWKRNLPLKST